MNNNSTRLVIDHYSFTVSCPAYLNIGRCFTNGEVRRNSKLPNELPDTPVPPESSDRARRVGSNGDVNAFDWQKIENNTFIICTLKHDATTTCGHLNRYENDVHRKDMSLCAYCATRCVARRWSQRRLCLYTP